MVQETKVTEACGTRMVSEDWVNKRWPTRIFYGEKGQLMHPYTRIQTPNLKLMNCYYRCKSYRTFGCDARVQMREISDKPGLDECLASGEHSEQCKQKNSIKPANFSSSDNTTEAKIKDVSEDFKNRLIELATEKIWLAPMKIWSLMCNEIGSAGNDVALSFPNSDVVRTRQCYVYNNLTTIPSLTKLCLIFILDATGQLCAFFFRFHGKLCSFRRVLYCV